MKRNSLRNILEKGALTILGFLITFSHLTAQERPDFLVSYQAHEQRLNIILIELKYAYGIKFDFDAERIKSVEINRAKITRQPLNMAMKILLHDTGLEAIILGPKHVRIVTEQEVPKKERQIFTPTRSQFTASGVIQDAYSAESLPNGTIYVNGTKVGTISNSDGRFSLFNVPSDTSTLIAKYLGYRTLVFRLEPGMDVNQLTLGLFQDDMELTEVVIEGQKEGMIKSNGISHLSLNPMQLVGLPGIGEKDIFRSLQLLPGVSGTNETSSGLYVRGGTPDQNLVLFDGFTVYHVDHFYGFFSAFNPEAVKDVQFYKGGFGAKYGGRLSSVIDLSGKNGNMNKVSGSAGISLLAVNATLEIPLGKKGTLFLGGRRALTDIVKGGLYDKISGLFTEAPPEGGNGRFQQFQTEPSFYFYDINAKATFLPSDKDVLSVSFYRGQDKLDNSRAIDAAQSFGGGGRGGGIDNDTEDVSAWGNTGASLKWSRQWSPRLYSNSLLSYSNYFSERDYFSISDVVRDDTTRTFRQGSSENNDVQDMSFRNDNEYEIAQGHKLKFGLQATRNDIAYDYIQNDSTEILSRDEQGAQVALYLEDNLSLFDDRLSLVGGVRGTWNQETAEIYVTPRLSASLKLTPKLKVNAAWGIYNQFINRVVREDVLQGSRDFWMLSNGEDVPIGEAIHYILGMEYETDTWLFNIEGYRKEMTGLAEFSLRFNQTQGPGGPGGQGGGTGTIDYDEFFYEGEGIAQGVEFLVQKKVGKYTGWIGYTLGEVKHKFDIYGEEYFAASHDQTHEVKFVNTLKLGQWTLGGVFVYATGKPYSSPENTFQLELLDGTTYEYITVGAKNSYRLPDYHRLDLSATYSFNMGAAKTSLGLSIFNAYGRKNVWYKEFEVVEDQVIETDVNFLGFTPSVFLNINFK